MAIVIKHGAEIEGKGIAYGAAAQAAYIREQEKRRRKEEKRAKRLGNIGSALGVAGAVATFIPGMQVVGAGLSVAGGLMGGAAGGRGDPTGKAAAATAQGIARVYHAYGEQVKAKQDNWEEWKKRQDYTHELSSLKKQENLDLEIEARDREFSAEFKNNLRNTVTKVDAMLEAVGLPPGSGYNMGALDESLMEGPYSKMYQEIRPQLDKMLADSTAENQRLQWIKDNNPATTVEEDRKRKKEEAETVQSRLEQEQKIIDQRAKREEASAYKRSAGISTGLNIIADVEAKLSKAEAAREGESGWLNEDATKALTQQRNTEMGKLSIIIADEIDATSRILANGDPEITEEKTEEWVRSQAEKLVLQHRETLGRDLSEEEWSRSLGKITHDYRRIANAKFNEMNEAAPFSTRKMLAEFIVRSNYNLPEEIISEFPPYYSHEHSWMDKY